MKNDKRKATHGKYDKPSKPISTKTAGSNITVTPPKRATKHTDYTPDVHEDRSKNERRVSTRTKSGKKEKHQVGLHELAIEHLTRDNSVGKLYKKNNARTDRRRRPGDDRE